MTTDGGLLLVPYITVGGGLLSLLLIFGRRMIPSGVRERLAWPALRPKGPIPYGVAICVGTLFALALNGPNPNGRPKLPELQLKAFPEQPIG